VVATLRQRFGSRLRQIRLSRRLTQERLAEELDWSVNFLNLIERGQRAPSFDNIEKLERVLQVEASDLFKPPEGI
jgi:transcriptional regulator with XRE-family HTH domain